MPDVLPADSVGLVTPRTFRHDCAFDLQCGEQLPCLELVYETYGTLNAARSNAVLICHALSGHHHAAVLAQGRALVPLVQEGQRVGSHVRTGHLDCGDEAGEEPARFAVVGIQREPCHARVLPGRAGSSP